MRGRTITAMATLALAASVLGAYAQTTTNATPNGSHVLQGDFKEGNSPTFSAGNNSKRVGYGGATATSRCNQPIWGLDLPEIPAGESLSAATLSVDVTAITGNPLFFEVLASLMTATDVSEFAVAPDQYFVTETAPLDSTLANGIVFAQFAQSDVPVGGTLEIPVTGAALAQLNSLYNAAGLPNQSTVWFRLSTSVTNDPAAWQGGDRIQFADHATESTWAAFGLELNWADVPVFIADPIVKANVAWGSDYALLTQSLAGSATNSPGDTMFYEKVGGPDWLVVATNGALSGIADVTGTNDFSIKALAAGESTIGNLQIVVDTVGNPPVFTTNINERAVGTFGADYALESQTLDGSATDADFDTLIYSRAGGGPAWLNVASNGALSGVCAALGTNTFPIQVTDGNGNFDTASLVIIVQSAGSPPEFTVDPIVKADGLLNSDYASQSQTLAGSATDPDGGDTLTYSKDGGPSWLIVSTNGALSGVASASGTNSFTVQVDDGSGNSDTATLLIYVAPLPDQLLHHWPFDEGSGAIAEDVFGSSDGVIANATWTNDVTRSSYLAFNGTDSSVNPSVTMQAPTADNGETWACWVLDPSSSANNNDIIIGNRGVGGADFGKILPSPANGGRFGYRNDVLEGYNFNDGNVSLVRDVWTHVAFVRDGINATFYINGVLVNGTPYPLSLDNASALSFFMGGEPGLNANEHFEGGIDDVVLYNYALPPENVMDVMNGIYNFGPVDLSNAITDYSFNPSGTSSLSFTGGVSSAYVIKSKATLPFGNFETVTPSAVTTGSLAGDVITTDGTGAATAEFSETAPAQFYIVESAPQP